MKDILLHWVYPLNLKYIFFFKIGDFSGWFEQKMSFFSFRLFWYPDVLKIFSERLFRGLQKNRCCLLFFFFFFFAFRWKRRVSFENDFVIRFLWNGDLYPISCITSSGGKKGEKDERWNKSKTKQPFFPDVVSLVCMKVLDKQWKRAMIYSFICFFLFPSFLSGLIITEMFYNSFFLSFRAILIFLSIFSKGFGTFIKMPSLSRSYFHS